MSSVAQPRPTLPPGAEAGDVKHLLREAIRASRRTRSPRVQAEAAAQLAEVVAAVPDVAHASCVALYASRPGEPGTVPLLDKLAERGKRVLLPVLGSGLQRAWAEYAGPQDLSERAPGRPPEPSTPPLGPDAIQDVDVVVAPALAVDTTGARLGNGGGWYDRVLEHTRADTPVIAVVYAEELYDASEHPLPRESHDRLVDAVATPEGWRWLRTRVPG